jgi:D-alanine-D-alanine ligase
MLNKDLRIAVLTGWTNAERQVSLQSGKMIADAIAEAGLDAVTVDITPQNMSILDDDTIDIFYLALHGRFVEDGRLQEILQQKNLCYVGSDSKASKLAFDKVDCKKKFRKSQIKTPLDIRYDQTIPHKDVIAKLEKLGENFVVKPITQGSSVGVKIVNNPHDAIHAAKEILAEYGDCMIEEFIKGREITVGILNGQTLPVIEIKSKTAFYDYYAKYTDDKTEYLFDTINEEKVLANINRAARDCFNTLNCRHMARVDMILTDDNTPYVLEINTLPGFTSHSLLPMAANKAGISNSQLCVRIIKTALESFQEKQKV